MLCERCKDHIETRDMLMHWAPDGDTRVAVCGTPVGIGTNSPFHIISKDCIIELTCPICKEKRDRQR